MKKVITIFLLLFSIHSYGNGINVSNVSFNESTNEISFSLTWENSWTFFNLQPDLHDAAWIFIKYSANGGDSWQHAEILDSTAIQNHLQFISYDDLGIMIYKTTSGNSSFGPVTMTLELAPMQGAFQDFKVFATETVFIGSVAFYAGDGLSSGRFYENNVGNPLLIDNEDAILRGSAAGEFGQEGIASGPNLNADFPKGYESFFCMKYKITARQYTDFLNCLSRTQQDARTQADLSGPVASNKYVMTNTATVQDRNPIACNTNIGTGPIEFYLDLDPTNNENSPNDGGDLVMNHMTPMDIIAYLDWSGMRPMSELEYEKICRGDVTPVGGEYVWGTDTWNPAGTITNPGTIAESTSNVGILTSLYNIGTLRSGYSATATSGRTESSATYYGVMDMHNLGEFMYGIGSSNFSRFSYGDGNLSTIGNAQVPGWTSGAQLLSTQDTSSGGIEPISQGKNVIVNTSLRSAHLGARGVRKLVF